MTAIIISIVLPLGILIALGATLERIARAFDRVAADIAILRTDIQDTWNKAPTSREPEGASSDPSYTRLMDNEHIYAATQQLDHSLNRVLDDLRTLETYLQNIEARQMQMQQTLQRIHNDTR